MRSLKGDLTAVGAACGIVGLVLLGIVWLNHPYLARAIAFEDSPLAWLQSSVLVASAMLCLPLAATGNTHGRRRAGWYAIGALLLFAALDERFMFHEKTAAWLFIHPLHRDAARAQLATAVPMLAYAIVALGVSLWLWRATQRGRPWIVAAATIAIIAVTMDVRSDAVGPQVIEELLELAAETLFLCALLVTWRGALNRSSDE